MISLVPRSNNMRSAEHKCGLREPLKHAGHFLVEALEPFGFGTEKLLIQKYN